MSRSCHIAGTRSLQRTAHPPLRDRPIPMQGRAIQGRPLQLCPTQYRAVGLVLAVLTCGAGCGENVLVASWDLRLTGSDAGAEAAPQAPDAGGLLAEQAAANQAARKARKNDDNHDGDGDSSSNSDDESSH